MPTHFSVLIVFPHIHVIVFVFGLVLRFGLVFVPLCLCVCTSVSVSVPVPVPVPVPVSVSVSASVKSVTQCVNTDLSIVKAELNKPNINVIKVEHMLVTQPWPN